MKENKIITKSLKISIIISILFVAILRLKPIWERNLKGLFYLVLFISIAILFFWIILKIIIEITRIIRNRKSLSIISFLPITILLLCFSDGIYNPMNINLDILYGEVNFRACYEGTQNQATFKLREGNKFEIHWTGIFHNYYDIGTYTELQDTLFLKYEGKAQSALGNKIFMDNENKILRPIYDNKESLDYNIMFYYGYCKGLN